MRSEWDQLIIKCGVLKAGVLQEKKFVLNYEICAWSFAKMWFRISILVKTVELCSELSSLESCSWYMSVTHSLYGLWMLFNSGKGFTSRVFYIHGNDWHGVTHVFTWRGVYTEVLNHLTAKITCFSGSAHAERQADPSTVGLWSPHVFPSYSASELLSQSGPTCTASGGHHVLLVYRSSPGEFVNYAYMAHNNMTLFTLKIFLQSWWTST